MTTPMFEVKGNVIQDGELWSAVAANTGWSPQFHDRKSAVEWLRQRGVKVEGELYPAEKKSIWDVLKFWKK